MKERLKLSKTQETIVALMNDGWALGLDGTMIGRAWMQKGGLGCGGETRTVSLATFYALRDRGVILEGVRHFPTTPWHLHPHYRKPHVEGAR